MRYNGLMLSRSIRVSFGAILLALIALSLVALVPTTARAETDPSSSGFTFVPECDPSLFPNSTSTEKGGPCNFTKFQELVTRIIKWLVYIIFPIAFCIMAWAGFKIMTSAGNGEAVHEAFGMIKIAVTGILIAGLSYLIIVYIFKILSASTS